MWHMSLPWWQFIVRSTVVYIFVLLLLRIAGKREIGQMGAAEFVAILLVSNAVQNSMNGNDGSVTAGLMMATVIIVLSMFTAWLAYKYPSARKVIEGEPVLLIHNGRLVHSNLKKVLMTEGDVLTALHEQGVHSINEVSSAILESDGKISITHRTNSEIHHNHCE